jgi:sugar lactone lactonase YvrE
MKNIILVFATMVGLSSVTTAQKLTLKWKTDTLLHVPESVLYDAVRNKIYVANIDGAPWEKDGKGSIGVVSTNGKIEKAAWVTGLDAPKGMGLYKNNLYVADVTRVVVIDVASGKITNKIEIEGVKTLNDITVDKNGKVYISDSGTGKIYTLNNGKGELYFESTELVGTNGVLSIADGLYLVDFANGQNWKLSFDKKLTKFCVSAEKADGVAAIGNGDYIVSSWPGQVFYVTASGVSTKLLDTTEQKISSADIDYDAKTKTLYVPTFFANMVMAYSLGK